MNLTLANNAEQLHTIYHDTTQLTVVLKFFVALIEEVQLTFFQSVEKIKCSKSNYLPEETELAQTQKIDETF